jgi:prolipoprotein diacylglyceryltransferase
MKITPYGLIAGFSTLIFLGLVDINNNKSFLKFALVIISSLILFTKICYKCDQTYNMVSFMGVYPILVLLANNCQETYSVILAFSLFGAISRIGCLFAGCCTGKETNSSFSLKYEGNYMVNKNTNKNTIRVKPTIILEILLQFLFAYITLKSKNPLLFFGILNGFLIIASDFWRLGGRAIDKKIILISSFSLILFSVISVFKCENFIKPKINFNLNIFKIIISIVIIIISSNDINFGKKKLKKNF